MGDSQLDEVQKSELELTLRGSTREKREPVQLPSTTHLDSAPSLSMAKRPIETIVLDDSDDERDSAADQDEFEAQLARAIALSKRESDHAGSSSSTQVKGDTSE